MKAETSAITFFLSLSIRSILGILVSLLSLTTLHYKQKQERIING
ncbi:MAG: hypothetical protein WBZ36_01160 [Candidatus Nitrosopolaris sp.]